MMKFIIAEISVSIFHFDMVNDKYTMIGILDMAAI